MLLALGIRYRKVTSIYYETTELEVDESLSDEEIHSKCKDHLSKLSDVPIANWFIETLKHRKNAKRKSGSV